jgi:hypothetical protein
MVVERMRALSHAGLGTVLRREAERPERVVRAFPPDREENARDRHEQMGRDREEPEHVDDAPRRWQEVGGMTATGGCLCGAVRYEVNGPLRDVVVCHCRRCRRTHGHVAAYAACAHADLVFTSAGGLCWYESEDRSRGFCGNCGASLFWRAAGRPTTSIAAGTLDEPTGLRTIAQIHTADQGDYYAIEGEGERFTGDFTPR